MAEFALVEPLDGQPKKWVYDSRDYEVTPDNWRTKPVESGAADVALSFYSPRGDGKVPDRPVSVRLHPLAPDDISTAPTLTRFEHPDGTVFGSLADLLTYTAEQAVAAAQAGTLRADAGGEDPRRAAMLAEAGGGAPGPASPAPAPSPAADPQVAQALQTAGLRREAGRPPSEPQPARSPSGQFTKGK